MIYAVGDIAPRLLSFISFPILTSYLSPKEYGIVNYVNTVNLFLMAIGFLCLNTFYLVYYYRQPDDEARRKLLGNLSIFILGLNLVLTAILLLFGQRLLSNLDTHISFYPYLAIGLVTYLFNVPAVLPSALYRLQERPWPLTIINIIKGLILFGITLWFVVGLGFKAEGLLYAQMAVTIVFGIIFLWITLKNMTWHFDWRQIRFGLAFSLPLLPGSLSYLLTSMFDRILIEKYLNLSDLGIYSTASTIALILNIVSYGAYKAFEPYIFKNYGSATFESNFLRLRNAFFCVMLSGAMGLALFAKEFYQIFSQQEYHIAYIYVPIIIIGVFCGAMCMPYGTVVTARGKTKINSAITIVGGLFSVSMNVIFLRHFGIIAACITSSVTWFMIMSASVYFSKVRLSHLKPVCCFLITAATVALLVYAIDISQIWLSLVIKATVYISTVLLLFQVFGINTLEYIKSTVKIA